MWSTSFGMLSLRPHSEVFHPFLQDLLKLSMHVLACDNEENGLICLRIIFDLHKNFMTALGPDVQQFLDFVHKIYQNFPPTVSYVFDESSTGDVPAPHYNHGYMVQMRSPAGGLMSGQLNPSTRSFKVVTECPLIVMFLFQLYPRYVLQNIPVLLPLMVSAIGTTGPTEVPPTLKNIYAGFKERK